jgi:hypothetical protein
MRTINEVLNDINETLDRYETATTVEERMLIDDCIDVLYDELDFIEQYR